MHDTHAGAGSYAIASDHMQKTGEYRDGIARLLDNRTGVGVIDQYVALVKNSTRWASSPSIRVRR